MGSRNSFIRQSKLHNVGGRIDYISNPKRQEHLYAVYNTAGPLYWEELAKQNQFDFKRYRSQGTCIEARELVIALPKSFAEKDPDLILKLFTEKFRTEYGVQCSSALHHNKARTNYHIHLIYSERKLLEEREKKIATRNMFYNEEGRHVRTKKEILDAEGNIRPGCFIIPKGEIYEMNFFEEKNEFFKSNKFLGTVKQMYTELINQLIEDPKEHLTVFDPKGPFLPTKKIGKSNPKEDVIKKDNALRQLWNSEVEAALVEGVPEEELVLLKKEEITDKISLSMEQNGKQPELFSEILKKAVSLLKRLMNAVIAKSSQFAVTEKKSVRNQIAVPAAPAISIKAGEKTVSKNTDLSKALAEYNRMKPIQTEIWKLTRKKRWYSEQIEELQKELNGLGNDLTHTDEKLKLKKRIAYRKSRLSEVELKLKVAAVAGGFTTVRDATNAYWRAKDALEKAEAVDAAARRKQVSEPQKRPSILAELKNRQEEIRKGDQRKAEERRKNGRMKKGDVER